MDAVILEGIAYLAILDISQSGLEIIDDKVDVTSNLDRFVDDFNSRLLFEMNDLDNSILKDGINVNKWVPEYFKIDTTYFNGNVLAEVSFEEN